MNLDIANIETDRLVLRAPVADDVGGFVNFFTSDRAKYTGGSADANQGWSELSERIGHWILRGFGSYVITRKDTGTAIGHVGGVQPPSWPECEIGWSLWQAEDEGSGYASEAARAVIRHVFIDLGWDTAVSYIAPDNAASITMTKRLGATQDQQAKTPAGLRCLVYRHPHPENLK